MLQDPCSCCVLFCFFSHFFELIFFETLQPKWSQRHMKAHNKQTTDSTYMNDRKNAGWFLQSRKEEVVNNSQAHDGPFIFLLGEIENLMSWPLFVQST